MNDSTGIRTCAQGSSLLPLASVGYHHERGPYFPLFHSHLVIVAIDPRIMVLGFNTVPFLTNGPG